jgi:hypothetical protein
LLAIEATWGVVNDGAKLSELSDRMKSVTTTTMGILVEDTNDRPFVRLNESSNCAELQLLKCIICNTSDVSGVQGFLKDNNVSAA